MQHSSDSPVWSYEGEWETQLENERALVRRILEGDSAAFRVIVEEYGRMVTHIVSRMVYDRTEREDLTQDVFLRLYESLGRFEFKSKLSTYVARIAYNTCLNFLEKRRPSLFEDEFPERGGVESCPGPAAHPDVLAHRSGVAEILGREIAALPVRHRTALTLFHIHSLSYEEIGEVMGLPEGTVKSYLFRARKALHERLSGSYSREELES